MFDQSRLREQFKNLIRTISASECSIIEPSIHSCIVTVGEELRVLRFGPGQEDFYVEMYTQGAKTELLWSLTDLILGYKRGATEIKRMTTLEEESIMYILESFRNLSPFSAAKLSLLHKEHQNNISAQTNIREGLSTMKTEESVERICLADGCRDPNLEYKRASPSKEKNSQTFNNTLQTSLETNYNAKWYPNTSEGDISSSRSSEEKIFSCNHSNECALSASEHCYKRNDQDTRVKGERAVNAAQVDSTFHQERKQQNIEYNNSLSRSSYYKDRVELANIVSSESKNITDIKTISPTPCKNTLLMDFEKDLDCKTKPSSILSQRKVENGGAVTQVDQDNSYNGLQVSFKDSVEVLVSVAGRGEHGINETTPSLISNIADPFLTSTSQAANENEFKTSFKVGAKPQIQNSSDQLNIFFRSTDLRKKRRCPSLLCEEIGCSYKARSRGELQQHRRKHTGERPISCEWKSCAKKFKDKSTYRVHYKSVHLKRRDYKCLVPGCEKTFGCAKSRNRHSSNINLHQNAIIRLPETQS